MNAAIRLPAPLRGPQAATPVKVAVVPKPAGGSTEPAVADAVRRAADALADAGYAVEVDTGHYFLCSVVNGHAAG